MTDGRARRTLSAQMNVGRSIAAAVRPGSLSEADPESSAQKMS